MKIYHILILLFIMVLTSCEHKELWYDNGEAPVKIVFDWAKAPEAEPAGMRADFFNISGVGKYEENMDGKNGGYADAPGGLFNVVCFNNDTETIEWDFEDKVTTLSATTRGGSILGSITGFSVPTRSAADEPIIIAPDRMWRVRKDSVTVVNNDNQITLTLQPEVATKHVIFDVDKVSNSKNISLIRCTISGTSSSLYMGTGLSDNNPATIAFDGVINKNDSTHLSGETEIFGFCKGNDVKHILTIYCWSSGGNIKASFDVTSQINEQAEQNVIHIVLKDKQIAIPEAVGGGGFNPEVDDWKDEESDIGM